MTLLITVDGIRSSDAFHTFNVLVNHAPCLLGTACPPQKEVWMELKYTSI